MRNRCAYPQPLSRQSTRTAPVENRLSVPAPVRARLAWHDLSTEIRFTIHIHFDSLLKPSDLLILFAWSPVSR
ncbi:hypothetical protein KQH31_31485, partial [Streptomyces sp. CHA15]|nr:hypothetical protein [Streptomyces sp. CHA15]